MDKENLEERKMSADGYSFVPSPVEPAGGKAKHGKTGADKKIQVDPVAGKVDDGVTKVTMNAEKNPETDLHNEEVEEEYDLAESISALFEGLDLSEDFKTRASMVFEAAVNEASEYKVKALVEEVESNLREEFETALNESMDELVENLDSYLDYVVSEWMEENKVAIESGIRVEMAESLMDGLKELFYEHNIDIDEETIDVVKDLEEELEEIQTSANRAINENLELRAELQSLRADRVFNDLAEGLSPTQVERFRILSERIDATDLDEYASNLETIKESFFKKKSVAIVSEDISGEGDEVLTEETTPVKTSRYDTVNALAQAMDRMRK